VTHGAGEHGRCGRMAFTGWPAEAVEFYDGLEFDNS
jgi:hypothetical protein